MPDSMNTDQQQGMRIDKWLWAARFFKSRSLAAEAVSGGKVHLNDARVKPARMISPGDWLRVHRGQNEYVIQVVALAKQRRPAVEAQALYQETEESLAKRQTQREERKFLNSLDNRPVRRPNKRDRRHIIRFTRQD